jgi:kynurenine formamidase
MTRGVLLDIAALKGVVALAETYEITPQDLQDALAAQKLTLQPGDAVLIHTGWGTWWGRDNARYQRVSPGIGTGAAEWLARQDPMLVGADNTAVEISPNPDPDLAGPVHQIMLVVNGIHLLEDLRLRRAGRAARLRVRADCRAAQDSRWNGLDGSASRGPVTSRRGLSFCPVARLPLAENGSHRPVDL